MKTLTMLGRSDWCLPLFAVLILLAGGVGFKLDQRLPPVVWEGRDLISGLDPKELTKLTITKGGQKFSLLKQGDGFVIDTFSMAPADRMKVNELLLKLAGAQINEVIGDKEDHDRFQVKDKMAELEIEIYTGKDSPNWSIILGKSLSGKPGRAVRVAGNDEVFGAKEYLYVSTSAGDYVDKMALTFNKSEIKGLEVFHLGKRLSEDKFVRQDLLDSLSPMRVEKHHRTGELPQGLRELAWDWKGSLLLEDGVLYTVSWGKQGDKWYARAKAQLNQAQGEVAPVIDLSLLTAKASADRFNQQKMPWIWELSSESADKLTRGLMHGKENKNKVSKK